MLKRNNGQKRALNIQKRALNIRRGCFRTPRTPSDTPLAAKVKKFYGVVNINFLNDEMSREGVHRKKIIHKFV